MRMKMKLKLSHHHIISVQENKTPLPIDFTMGDLCASLPDGGVSLPVIDLSRGRDECSRAILDAGKEMGFFQASILVFILYLSWLCQSLSFLFLT